MRTLISNEISNIVHFLLLKVTQTSVNDGIFFKTLRRYTLILAPLVNCVSDFTAEVFFVRKRAFYLNISTKKDTTKDKIINTSSLE